MRSPRRIGLGLGIVVVPLLGSLGCTFSITPNWHMPAAMPPAASPYPVNPPIPGSALPNPAGLPPTGLPPGRRRCRRGRCCRRSQRACPATTCRNSRNGCREAKTAGKPWPIACRCWKPASATRTRRCCRRVTKSRNRPSRCAAPARTCSGSSKSSTTRAQEPCDLSRVQEHARCVPQGARGQRRAGPVAAQVPTHLADRRTAGAVIVAKRTWFVFLTRRGCIAMPRVAQRHPEST